MNVLLRQGAPRLPERETTSPTKRSEQWTACDDLLGQQFKQNLGVVNVNVNRCSSRRNPRCVRVFVIYVNVNVYRSPPIASESPWPRPRSSTRG